MGTTRKWEGMRGGCGRACAGSYLWVVPVSGAQGVR